MASTTGSVLGNFASFFCQEHPSLDSNRTIQYTMVTISPVYSANKIPAWTETGQHSTLEVQINQFTLL